MGFRPFGRDADGGVVGGHGLIEAAQFPQRAPEIGPRRAEVRVDADGGVVGGDGLIEAGQLAQRLSEVVMIRCVKRVDLDRVPDQFGGDIVLSRLMCDHTQQMPGVGVTRIRRQHKPIESFRVWKSTGLMQPQRLGELGLAWPGLAWAPGRG